MATETSTKKAPAKKSPAKKSAAENIDGSSIKEAADKAVNIYLGVIGKGVDAVQDYVEQARKDSKKRVTDLEKRGAKLRNSLVKRFDNLEIPEMENVIDDVKEQLNKAQGQVEDAVDTIKEKLTPVKVEAKA